MRAAGTALVALGAAFLAACAPALTEIVVVVDSDLAVPAGMDGVQIRVTNELAMTTTSMRAGTTAATLLPATLGVRPKTDDAAPVTIVAAATLHGTDVVTSEVRTHFVPGRRLVLQIFLSANCRMVPCMRGTTCSDGHCVNSMVDPTTLPPFDGHIPTDGGPTDSGRDAPMTDAGDAGADAGPVLDAGSDGGGGDAGGCVTDAECDDGVFCNGAERCIAGTCFAAARLPTCDDLVACTIDSCSGSGCVHTPSDALCTAGAGGHCDATTDCQYTTCSAATCASDASTCTSAVCVGSMCMRTSTCTGGQMCCHGACVAAGCDDGNLCTNDSCDAATGCVHVSNAAPCTDGNACTLGDVCSGGACAPGGGRLSCDDGDPCNVDSCDAAAGCTHVANPSACDDLVACTHDSCGTSGCTHTPDDSLCTMSAGGTCAPVIGCQYPTCTAVSCPGNAATCTAGVCVGATCMHPSTCSGSQMCCAGSCVPTGCDDGNPCTTDSCGGSGCTHASAMAGTACPGGLCTSSGTCCTGCVSAGVCVGGSADGACGYGGHTCSTCTGCAGGICAGGEDCTRYFDVSGAPGTSTVLAIDTCALADSFTMSPCFEGAGAPPGTRDAVLSGTSPGNYMITAEPGWSVGSLSDTGSCMGGVLNCSNLGTWGVSGAGGGPRFYFGLERTDGGCGRVTVTVTRS